jgi:cell division inhibitor SulA
MNTLKVNNINMLSESPSINPFTKNAWLNIKDVKNEENMTQQYVDIYQEHRLNNKWILMINPDNKPLALLSDQGEIDPKKILKVNAHKGNINLENIEDALVKGNCAAVILCNATLEKSQIELLTQCAKKGKTQCIILRSEPSKKKQHLH